MRSGEQSGRPCENELREKERRKETKNRSAISSEEDSSICEEFDITSGATVCYDLAMILL